jgi:hypothetical protein
MGLSIVVKIECKKPYALCESNKGGNSMSDISGGILYGVMTAMSRWCGTTLAGSEAILNGREVSAPDGRRHADK